jgi:AraC-like DNA-binding protein
MSSALNPSLNLLPALTLQMQMRGLATLGIDMQRVHSAVGPVPESPDALVPAQTYLDMWREAHAQYGMPGLPTALASAIPFGSFGALDYLAGSADTVAGCCQSAVLHFAMVASDTWLEHQTLEDGAHVVQARGTQQVPVFALEFTIAVLMSRLRYITDGRFVVSRVGLPIPKPEADPVRERLWGAALVYDFPVAEILIDPDTWNGKAVSADPFLHATLKRMADQLQLAHTGDTALERALRVRLRPALAQGRADSARIASLLGISERTLQRRLAEAGHSYTEIVENFRREESARLLVNPTLPLIEVAARLGYTEQTSFTRAFRRWTGTTPSAWRANRRVVDTG